VEFRILGPLEVVGDGNPVALGTLKERLVLGVLLLHANEFVSRQRLIDDLWGEAPPPTAHKAVNVYLSKIRKALGVAGADPITTASGGYRLHVELEKLDASRMQGLLAEARSRVAEGELHSAAERFQEALSLWRGPTLAGLELESRGRDEVAQLDELRLAALMDRIDCDLALGRHEQVLGELGVLVREHPLRERLRAQQMLALYRADRQADALEAYAEARRALVDDLGIEPSASLQRLQQAILRHDPSLETPEGTAGVNGRKPRDAAPPATTTSAEAGEKRPRTQFRPRRWQLALAGVVLLAASGATAAFLSQSARATPRILPNSLVQLDPRTGKPILVKQVGIAPNSLAITPTAIWAVDDDEVSRYDLHTHNVDTSPITSHSGSPFGIAFDKDGNAWVTSASESQDAPRVNAFVTRVSGGPGVTGPGMIDPAQGLLQTMRLPLPMAGSEALGTDNLWVISGPHGPLPGDNRLAVVDVHTFERTALKLDERATAIAYGYHTVWVGTYGGPNFGGNRPDDSRLEAIRAGQLEAIRTGRSNPLETVLEKHGAGWGPFSIAVGDGAVWVITGSSHQLLKIDPITLQIDHRLDLSAEEPGSVAVGAGAVWITGGHSVIKIDPRSDTIIHTYPIRVGFPCDIAATSTTLWVAVDGRSC
jgi:DNA-binding SARP family transcriptional activator/DNA-binding beta-propeller fold protein YncE